MLGPVILLFLSLAAAGATLWVPGAGDLIVLAGPAVLASLILLWRAARLRRPLARGWIVVDGSNVMHWKAGSADLAPLREVLRYIRDQGYTPRVVFDANAGYKLRGRYMDATALARNLGLARGNVIVVGRGNPADPEILKAARDLGARVVSNDRFRDWAEAYPQATRPDRLVRGGYRGGTLWMGLDPISRGRESRTSPARRGR
ncbi:hypothetical protein EKE94_04945 [Mesobaculum littorinae]|uniref:RNase NYN domain-containing protein n=1 Tax=Mesobaculum littorinae TaxID=2486419 RepID=A0A438AHU8_9RHOB|nr:hypothetical protein [Mesobaculum littorinae]RVV98280.1 hypothetical protein EKE94_04945 [Mesobaculum littorinae]